MKRVARSNEVWELKSKSLYEFPRSCLVKKETKMIVGGQARLRVATIINSSFSFHRPIIQFLHLLVKKECVIDNYLIERYCFPSVNT